MFDPDVERQVVAVDLGWQISEQVRLDVTVPRIFVESTSRLGAGHRTTHEEGLGDATVLVVWSPWAGEAGEGPEHGFWDTHHLSFQVGAKLPTGEDSRAVGAGANFAGLTQTGTGTTDLLLGVTYAPPIAEDVRLFASTLITLPTGQSTNAGFTPGQEWLQRLGVNVNLWDRLDAYASLDATFRSRNTGGTNAASRRDSGGTFLNVTPGFALQLWEGFSLEGSVSIPIYRQFNGRQLATDELWTIGIYKTW